MKVKFKKTILLYFWLPTWTMYTSLANFLKIWSNCGYWKSPKKHLFLALFIFQFRILPIYIYSYLKKKKALGALSWTTHPPAPSLAMVPPTLSLAMVRTTVMVLGGNNSFPVRRDSLAKLRRSRSRLLRAPVFLSYETTSQDGRKSGGVVQGVLHIDIQELLLLLLQAAASILLFLLLAILLAGRRCCCLGLGFHCSVCSLLSLFYSLVLSARKFFLASFD